MKIFKHTTQKFWMGQMIVNWNLLRGVKKWASATGHNNIAEWASQGVETSVYLLKRLDRCETYMEWVRFCNSHEAARNFEKMVEDNAIVFSKMAREYKQKTNS